MPSPTRPSHAVRRQRPVGFFLTSVLTASCALLSSARGLAADEPLIQRTSKPRVEMVFVIDTTGSMAGLIDGAKRKIWAIASEVRRAQQQPDVKIGLVAFKDKGDSYVTQVTPLTADVDAVYGQLMQLTADGGGDTPEDVNAGLHDAVTKMQWSGGKDVLKMVFLVGDAPPHMDYGGDATWEKTAQTATRKSIYINTVQCGLDGETTTVWRQIAHAAEGRYALIPQDGGVVAAITTPFDADLAGLARELDKTYLDYGSSSFRADKKAARKGAGGYAAAAPAATAADRAAYKASAGVSAKEDLVSLAEESGDLDQALASVKQDELPDELRGKDAEQARAFLQMAAKNRGKLQKAILELQHKREGYIAAENKKRGISKDAFDAEVIEMVKVQGAKAGLTY